MEILQTSKKKKKTSLSQNDTTGLNKFEHTSSLGE